MEKNMDSGSSQTRFDPSTDPRVQEALSRKYGNDVVILLPLKREQGTIAVFNSARELCGFISVHVDGIDEYELMSTWHPPTTIEPAPIPKATLADLELL
jgi:hypothetical protein